MLNMCSNYRAIEKSKVFITEVEGFSNSKKFASVIHF